MPFMYLHYTRRILITSWPSEIGSCDAGTTQVKANPLFEKMTTFEFLSLRLGLFSGVILAPWMLNICHLKHIAKYLRIYSGRKFPCQSKHKATPCCLLGRGFSSHVMLTTAGTPTTVYSHAALTSKVKCFPINAMKAYRGSRGTTPLILNFGTRWRWVANLTLRPHSGQNPGTHWRLGGSQSRSGRFWKIMEI